RARCASPVLGNGGGRWAVWRPGGRGIRRFWPAPPAHRPYSSHRPYLRGRFGCLAPRGCYTHACAVRTFPGRRVVAQQGSPPRRSVRAPASTRRRGNRGEGRFAWDADTHGDSEEDYPPCAGVPGPRWADQAERERRRRREPDDGPRTSRFVGDHRPRPGFRSRLAEARARRNRLMLFIWGGAGIAVAVIATVVVLQLGSHAPEKAP